MNNEEAYKEVLKAGIGEVIKSPEAIFCIFAIYGIGILVLNAIVSLKRKKRKIIFNPLLAIPTGMVCTFMMFVFLNLKDIFSNTLTFEILTNKLLVAVILSIPIAGVISMIAYIIKEYLHMRGERK